VRQAWREATSRVVSVTTPTVPWPVVSLLARRGTCLEVAQALHFPGELQKTGNGPTPQVDRKHNSGAPVGEAGGKFIVRGMKPVA